MMRSRFLWRIGFTLGLVFLLSVIACTALVWFIAAQTGLVTFPFLSFPGLRVWLAVLAVVVIFGMVFGGSSLRRITAPLSDMVDAASRVSEGDYTARVAERGPREVRALARSFNAMTGQLQANDQSRRNLLADITHELRTPLTIIQGNLEGLVDNVYPRDDAHLAPILEETRVISHLINDLRTLSLAESGGLRLQKERIDFGALVLDTVAPFRAQADAAGIELIAQATPELALTIDPARIREVLENSVANALRYTPSGGKIWIEYSPIGKNLQVRVSDTGSGIPPDELPRIFERWQKSSESQGTGLGLAIAKKLVSAHGGEIYAESLAGKGTTIRFTLPKT